LAPDKFDLSPLDLSISNDPFDQLDELTPALACNHPTLGFMIAKCHLRYCAYVSKVVQYTSEGRIKNARRKYVGSFIVLVNNCNFGHYGFSNVAFLSNTATFKIGFAPDRDIPIGD
jgi:hypothetical protein